jgi:hypothetical protein
MIKYPVPILNNNNEYTGCDIRKPSPGLIADVKKMAETGDKFSSTQVFIEGITTSIYKGGQAITDRLSIKSILKNTPYRTAEYILIKSMLLLDPSDYIEGYYQCPRCGQTITCELKEENDQMIFDTRDRISDLSLKCLEKYEDIKIDLSDPVEIMQGEEQVESVGSFVMGHPTLKDCITAYQRVGDKDDLRLQFAIYTEALKKINNTNIDSKWKNRNGKYLFDNLKNFKKDFVNITNKVNEYGLDKRLEKTCKNCGKVFKAVVNTSNFFDFDLQRM